jgi:LPXTG-motif cell wall-anchored protein
LQGRREYVRRLLGILLSVTVFIVVLAPAAWAEGDYPPAPTAGPVARVPGAAARQLPVTGANNTPSLILIGIAALVVGLVLVLAVRRRRALARGIA